ncbi:TylF/MycF/NovP-related O-methyltransferase [Streptomyces sp. NPDC057067]|uniref:TylF/MycF family methyltransferase n=3 Tax=Streptomyces TaxID=1883 RepID=A0AAU1LRM0_9ACTN|nr:MULTISPECIES: TylF/MycF/NovP-related O-methyltransferase [Streptomyces]WSS62244.1 TylF/MycF family methyltransferase [Streptomyces sp. NBC_01177]WSS69268.1 TylF/MycF family methyltransferase [Streptomyces sp. NBC_01175]MBL1289547.1 class I SAM-dependent methyltransferase [Streptomyces silvae]MDX3328316.1 macrocin O-methyltransferase [Streptomyces sp. ME02-6979-3A]MDX3429121.1 macrocin O-methyltransferase [Streptomyces sp. ME01-18a]
MSRKARVLSRPMAWRNAVNGVLQQLTGYQLRRATLPAPRRAPAQPPVAAPKQAERPAPKAAAKKPPQFPADYDDEAKDIIRAVKPYTMTSPERLNAFVLATRHIVRHGIPGDIVECGVWRGGSMQACAKTLLSLGETDRDLYLFDTYEGMTPPTAEDLRRDGRPAQELLDAQGKDRPIWAVASLEDVRAGFEQVPYPEDRVHYVRGKVEDTVPEQAPEQISILRLDTDWYASTKHELTHLYSRLVSGGVLLIDDYGYWQGSRQAVDEFLEETGEQLLLLRMDEGRIAVKP